MFRLFFLLSAFFLACHADDEVPLVPLADHALRLAILKYNPDHQAPLIQEGDQHRKMLTFLKETLEHFPQLAKLPFYSSENRYRQLVLKSARPEKIKKLIRLASQLSQGCPYEKQSIKTQSTLSVPAQNFTEVITKTVLGMPLSPSGKRCRHPLITTALKLGMQELEFRQYDEAKTRLATLSFNSAFSQDMEYVQKALLQEAAKEDKDLLQAMVPAPLSRQIDYYESLISLRPTSNENIEVEFIDRWERGGILYKHHFFIRGTPISDPKRSFKIELMREFGPEKPK